MTLLNSVQLGGSVLNQIFILGSRWGGLLAKLNLDADGVKTPTARAALTNFTIAGLDPVA